MPKQGMQSIHFGCKPLLLTKTRRKKRNRKAKLEIVNGRTQKANKEINSLKKLT